MRGRSHDRSLSFDLPERSRYHLAPMKLGISTHYFGLWPLTQRFLALIREAGFEGIELWAMAPHLEIDEPDALALAARMASETGLRILSVHLPFYKRWGAPDFRYLNLGDPKPEFRTLAMRLTVSVLERLPDLGADLAVLHGVTERRRPDEEMLRLYEEDLTRIADKAAEIGATLAIENIMTPLSRSGPLADLLDRCGRPNVKACLDLGHANVNEDVLSAVRRLGPRIVTTHIHDNTGEDDQHLIPGRGAVDWLAAAAALREAGDSNIVLEVTPPDVGPNVDEKLFLDYLQKAREAAAKYFGL